MGERRAGLGFRAVLAENSCVLLRSVASLSLLSLAKLLFPTPSNLLPKCSVLRIDRLPLKLAAVFDLFFEKLLYLERHGAPLTR
jgi:hypothetical protein